MTAGDRFGASLPSIAVSASWKSPVEMPRRYSSGNSASKLRVRRAQRQNRRAEPDPLAIAGRPAVPKLRPRDLDRSDAGRNRSGRAVTMPHDTGAPVGQLQILHRGKKRLDFDLHGLRQKRPSTSSQNIGQWIVDLVGLTKGNNISSPTFPHSSAPLGVESKGSLHRRNQTSVARTAHKKAHSHRGMV